MGRDGNMSDDGILYSWYPGELGWLLCSYLPVLRLKSLDFDRTIISLPKQAHYLAEDFCECWPLDADISEASFYEGKILQDIPVPPEGAVIARPGMLFIENINEAGIMAGASGELQPRTWRKYGTEQPVHAADVLVAVRPLKRFAGRLIENKDYPHQEALCEQLLAAGVSCAAVGGMDNYCHPNMPDYRGIPLSSLSGLMAGAKLTVGQSSFPLHLAQLSGCSVVTWNGVNPSASRPRYETYWNPFGAGLTWLGDDTQGVHPFPQEVLEAIQDAL
jgi:hypothetical protein